MNRTRPHARTNRSWVGHARAKNEWSREISRDRVKRANVPRPKPRRYVGRRCATANPVAVRATEGRRRCTRPALHHRRTPTNASSLHKAHGHTTQTTAARRVRFYFIAVAHQSALVACPKSADANSTDGQCSMLASRECDL